MTMPFSHWERRPLTIDDIRERAPSAFAEQPHSSRSERYVYMPTYKVLEVMYREGFQAFQASQARSRKPDGGEYTKHLIRLRHPALVEVGGLVPEVALLNSHDGSSAFKLKLGAFRIVCLNGMVTGRDFAGVSVYHKGDVRHEVVEGAYQVINQAPALLDTVRALEAQDCNETEAEILAGQIVTYQYGDDEGDRIAPVEPFMLTKPRRAEDMATDLWTRYNVIQENVTKGGLPYRNSATGRRNTTRAVRGIDNDLRLNAALWDLTQQMLRLKNGTFDEVSELL